MDKMNDPISVLFIDDKDNKDNHVFLKRLFPNEKPSPRDLKSFSSYDPAVEQMNSRDLDMCLLDQGLGTRTGLDLFGEARSRGLENPVILVAGLRGGAAEMGAPKAAVSDCSDTGAIEALLGKLIRYAMERHDSETLLLKSREELESQVEEKTMELAKARMALREAAENMELFSRTISQGLRNPAADLKKLARRLMESCHDSLSENGKAYCELLMKNSEHISSMVENINTYIKANEPLT